MSTPLDVITPKVSAAIAAALGDEYAGADPVLRPSQYADIQINAALALAKKAGKKPRDVAEAIVANLDLANETSNIEVSGPGFINLTFSDEWLATLVTDLAHDERLGIPAQEPTNIPIDYSAPNVAKEMHVGHLRTTVVGDCLARTLEKLGHNVIRQNHIGDWGTPFGMLIEHLLEVGLESEEAALLKNNPNAFYQAARAKFDGNAEFATRSRSRVVKLQAGDPQTLELWGTLIELSKAYFNRIYTALDVTLTDDDLAGESTYNDELPDVCHQLETSGIAVVDDGALCVFLEEFTGREGKPVPLIIRKSDGGYGYATTDLATIRHRVRNLKASRILYVIGAPQALHLNMMFATAAKAGWLPEDVEATHIKIGNVLGEDRKILRTRSGAPLRLMDLLNESVAKAKRHIDSARPELAEEERAEIARQIGIGAVKYADLSVAHDSEYVFDLDRMLNLTGNTGPYLQYAATRLRSIFRSADEAGIAVADTICLQQPHERALALHLLEFGSTVAAVGALCEPHRLAAYLFDLAQLFSAFYENCPVLGAEDEDIRASRLALCKVTLEVLITGLDLLGIRAPERM
ncbi:arginine--tRNA ligase [Dermatophilus congolensis]|uniref:Arginine--tRNA ligase n=1 Tax=Dermatophilus congolensis TaxID=1863 RepID=A0AA46H1H2_9MICO|nr:arginine--tRNA ligase [Dermatophilus congolensis]MBO3143971.1 arginine--tRNA ligase [Dermatophilus congolensis]MBO3152961.1 arginine--tRNA ligase [Dermatophilus congolensis]MBO3160027.1 arginine--tRNA ligase [Dermatophilus congolensis]MBO3164249.1 arginine--tRNA ligase [Dermatophilus congolensis]MBO3177793.1 arginine--tRNA ligase [Dermatophilus congolensis]